MVSIPTSMLPLVSVIIVNYNYGLYIGEAIASVFAQNYPNIECLVVDDVSTDNSIEIVEELMREYPELVLIRQPVNGGQSVASASGLARSVGSHVIFLDADDYLLPGCIEAHMQVHLFSRRAVGFTSVDMLQIVDGALVTMTSQGFADHVRERKTVRSDALRVGAVIGFADRMQPLTSDDIHYVSPLDTVHWPWSPTSGNCFRRDALAPIMDNRHFGKLRSCSDIYLLRGVGVLSGSMLIDRPLAAYRIHGNNDFVRGATLNRIRTYNPTYLRPRSDTAITMLLDHFVDRADKLVDRLEAPVYLYQALLVLNDVWPPLPTSRLGIGYLTRLAIEHRATLMQTLGYQSYVRLIVNSMFRPLKAESVRGFLVAGPVFVLLLPIVWLLLKIDGRRGTRPQTDGKQVAAPSKATKRQT